eukprot:CAMPEP_0184681482 /NCGR_PEP_ID=MMETSP0312-20130426/4480_1 /TAXON_ID=31354 /ORGANISM="Compsopogon coeruleus, Strain SAG 36.94" /LENGTH=40 /DNA_ID= /DNA_START= /DNA_END= /DNA_ORIENTATION=
MNEAAMNEASEDLEDPQKTQKGQSRICHSPYQKAKTVEWI